MIEIVPLTAEQAALVNRENETALELQRLAEHDARAMLQKTLTSIQERFFDAVKSVLDVHQPGAADQCRFVHDEQGVLCLEIVRRGPRPPSAILPASAGVPSATASAGVPTPRRKARR